MGQKIDGMDSFPAVATVTCVRQISRQKTLFSSLLGMVPQASIERHRLMLVTMLEEQHRRSSSRQMEMPMMGQMKK